MRKLLNFLFQILVTRHLQSHPSTTRYPCIKTSILWSQNPAKLSLLAYIALAQLRPIADRRTQIPLLIRITGRHTRRHIVDRFLFPSSTHFSRAVKGCDSSSRSSGPGLLKVRNALQHPCAKRTDARQLPNRRYHLAAPSHHAS